MNNKSIITPATDSKNNKIIVSTKETNDANTYKGNIVLTRYTGSLIKQIYSSTYTTFYFLIFLSETVEQGWKP